MDLLEEILKLEGKNESHLARLLILLYTLGGREGTNPINGITKLVKLDFLLRYPFKDIEFGEDLEWSKRIVEKGFKIVLEPASAVLHSHNFYFSFIKTLKKYFDDAKLNNNLFNIWSWRNFPILAGYIVFKIFRDIGYILSLNKDMLYKIGWLFYSPVIRLAEFFGIILGANSKYLPLRLQTLFSLVSEVKKTHFHSQNLK